VAFRAKATTGRPLDNDEDPPGTFTFLGFTHYWALSRKGRPVVKRKTAAARLTRALKAIRDWCARHRHKPPYLDAHPFLHGRRLDNSRSSAQS
jgi:hypothetical protein